MSDDELRYHREGPGLFWEDHEGDITDPPDRQRGVLQSLGLTGAVLSRHVAQSVAAGADAELPDRQRAMTPEPSPTPDDMNDPLFQAIWQAIKAWDIARGPGRGYAGANGSDVMTILSAIRATTPEPDSSVTISEVERIRDGVRMLREAQTRLRPLDSPLTICTDTYASLDDMVDLIRAKLAHSESLTLWGVDGPDRTVCITGNNEQGETHAEWIAILMMNADLLLSDTEWLLAATDAARGEGE
jgi:hypothetical protein